MERNNMKNGIIYNGPSLLDGKPIVVIATYSDRNTKTGKVLQTYIIRSDISPLNAKKRAQILAYAATANSEAHRQPTQCASKRSSVTATST